MENENNSNNSKGSATTENSGGETRREENMGNTTSGENNSSMAQNDLGQNNVADDSVANITEATSWTGNSPAENNRSNDMEGGKSDTQSKVSVKHDPQTRPQRWEDTTPRDLFSRFFDEDEPFGPFGFSRILRRIDQRLFPRVDVSETDRDIKVMADIPGVDPENIEIKVEDNRIIISGRTERTTEIDKSSKPYRYERSYGEFRREFTLPTKVNEDQIRAVYKDGILSIMLPKIEEEKKNRIRIERE